MQPCRQGVPVGSGDATWVSWGYVWFQALFLALHHAPSLLEVLQIPVLFAADSSD